MPLFLNKKTCRDVQVFFNDMLYLGRDDNLQSMYNLCNNE